MEIASRVAFSRLISRQKSWSCSCRFSRKQSIDSQEPREQTEVLEHSKDDVTENISQSQSSMTKSADQFKQLVREFWASRNLNTKVKLTHIGASDRKSIMLNPEISTPLDVARHLGSTYITESVLARVSWDPLKGFNSMNRHDSRFRMYYGSGAAGKGRLYAMNEPLGSTLVNGCIDFIRFKGQKAQKISWMIDEKDQSLICDYNVTEPSPELANTVFWNTCGLLTGAVLPQIFKSNYDLELLHTAFELTPENSGCFGYVFRLQENIGGEIKPVKWEANCNEISIINRNVRKFILQSLPTIFSMPLKLSDLEKVFPIEENKLEIAKQILDLQGTNGSKKVNLCLIGDSFVDIHPGPLLPSVECIDRFEITSIYPIDDEGTHIIQGIALPKVLPTHHSAWSVIRENAKSKFMQPTQSFAQYYVEQQKQCRDLQIYSLDEKSAENVEQVIKGDESNGPEFATA